MVRYGNVTDTLLLGGEIDTNAVKNKAEQFLRIFQLRQKVNILKNAKNKNIANLHA